jgi:hypothetical protein
MHDDTIFPALPYGENILGKYTYSECNSNLQTIIILTNTRLLIRRKHTICCCSTRSSYTSIALDSIDRVDEEPANTSTQFSLTMLTIFFISIVAFISGIQFEIIILIIVAAFGVVLSILALVLRYFLDNKHLIVLYGTFGSETIKLDQSLARDLEGKLLEMCYQTKLFFSNQEAMQSGQPTASAQPFYGAQTNPSVPYVVGSDKQNIYPRETGANNNDHAYGY